jgi:ubiquinone biosynthesis protein
VRLALTELGTTFIKLGQMLSTRPDLVGPEMAGELAHLQINTPADPPATVRATMEAEFGKPPDELFAHFKEEHLASFDRPVHAARSTRASTSSSKSSTLVLEDKIMRDPIFSPAWPSWRKGTLPELRPTSPKRLSGSSAAPSCAS